MIFSFYQIASFFFIYAFIGWCAEVAYQGVTNGKLVNRGFLNGPVCPIYGVGMVGVLLLLMPVSDHLLLLFIGGMIITTFIELFGGWILDKLFHMRWWDYSDKPFNLNGYICLEFCLIWGMGVVGIVRLIHPMIEKAVDKIPQLPGIVLLIIFTIIILVDTIVTYKTVIGITRDLGEMEKMAETLREISDSLTEKVGTTAIMATDRVETSKEKMNEAVAESKEKMAEAIAEGKEKIRAAKMETDHIKSESEILHLKLEMKKQELEEKYLQNMAKLQKKTKRLTKAFPRWHVSDKKMLFAEYMKNIRK